MDRADAMAKNRAIHEGLSYEYKAGLALRHRRRRFPKYYEYFIEAACWAYGKAAMVGLKAS